MVSGFVERLEARCRGEQRHLPVERDLGSEAGDLVAILSEHIRKDSVRALSSNQYSIATSR
jgi:hypothetical protein